MTAPQDNPKPPAPCVREICRTCKTRAFLIHPRSPYKAAIHLVRARTPDARTPRSVPAAARRPFRSFLLVPSSNSDVACGAQVSAPNPLPWRHDRQPCRASRALFTTVGRSSGLPRQIEIWFVAAGGKYYLLAEHFRRAQWVQNIERNPRVQVRLGGQERAATARILDETADRETWQARAGSGPPEVRMGRWTAGRDRARPALLA